MTQIPLSPRLLVISANYLRPDQASGDLRLFTLLGLLARRFSVCFCALDDNGRVLPSDAYGALLEQQSITLGRGDLPRVLRSHSPDLVWCEFFHQARPDYLALIRRLRPDARVLVDSVDVHFNRMAAQARLSGLAEDHAAATKMKARELAAYAQAELVVAVSYEDARLLCDALSGMQVAVVPNVHVIHPFPVPSGRKFGELVFVGGFKHAPNVDAMVYFCGEVLPLIAAAQPSARLKIIGSNPPSAIQSLVGERVEVVGYVPETAPYLESAYISVAPLRYGGGMKGKVGEAMSFGLPVVTTSFGAEGFGLEIGRDVLVGDTPAQFAAHVIALLENPELHAQLARNGHRFIEQHYSVSTVAAMLDTCMDQFMNLPPRRLPLARRIGAKLQDLFHRHITWRLKR